jgi:hypothetical protein
MEKNLERYYVEFERPPVAPTFTPTEEGFFALKHLEFLKYL